jgi:RIO-like serine/threonine protein kinase
MALEGAERRILEAILQLETRPADFISDDRIAAETGMPIDDIRNWLEILDDKGLVERTLKLPSAASCVAGRSIIVLRLCVLPIVATTSRQSGFERLDSVWQEHSADIRLS